MKKCLCLLLSLTMLCLCAGAALAETVALKVWGSQEDQELLAELCEAFAAEHPETTYEFTYGVVGEADAKARYLEDPAAAADVFSYPDDQIIDLVNADALYEVTRNHDAIVAANSVGSVNAASVGGVLYGYDFRNGRKPVQLLDFSPAEITQIHGDIHTVAEGNSDCVYVCTYEAGTPDSGRIRKYAVADTADRIELQADENTDWTGFQRIRSLWFKEL